MESNGRCPLLDISFELRERIYEFVFEAWEADETLFGIPCITMEESRRVNATSPLFQVNRQIRTESMDTYYHNVSVAICRNVGEHSRAAAEALAIREWLVSFGTNVGCLRHLVLKAVRFAEYSTPFIPDRDPDDYRYPLWSSLWRYRCHADLAAGSVNFTIRKAEGEAFPPEQRQMVRQRMGQEAAFVHSQRREGKLRQEHLRQFCDTYYSTFADSVLNYVYIHQTVMRNTVPLLGAPLLS
jgi:hypothetical protein